MKIIASIIEWVILIGIGVLITLDLTSIGL